MNTKNDSSLTETKDCKVPWCNRQSKANDERCEIHSEVHQAYVKNETKVQSSRPRCEARIAVQSFSKVDGWQTLETFTSHNSAIARRWEIERIQPLYKGITRVKFLP